MASGRAHQASKRHAEFPGHQVPESQHARRSRLLLHRLPDRVATADVSWFVTASDGLILLLWCFRVRVE